MEVDKQLDNLNKAVEDLATFYTALRNFLLELEALKDKRIKALFKKYEVTVK